MSSSIGSQEIGQIIQQILPLANDPKHLDEFKNHFEVLFNHLRLSDPPVPLDLNQEALTAFGLQDFVNLSLPSRSNQARQLIVEFVSFTERESSSVRQQVIEIKEVFNAALKLPPSVLTEAPAGVDPAVLQATALTLMQTYVLPHYSLKKYTKKINQALKDIEDGKAYRVHFAQLIYEEALREIKTLISEATRFIKRDENAKGWDCLKRSSKSQKMVARYRRSVNYKWSCKFSPFWHRLLEENFGTEAFTEHVRTLCIQQEEPWEPWEETPEINFETDSVNSNDDPHLNFSGSQSLGSIHDDPPPNSQDAPRSLGPIHDDPPPNSQDIPGEGSMNERIQQNQVHEPWEETPETNLKTGEERTAPVTPHDICYGRRKKANDPTPHDICYRRRKKALAEPNDPTPHDHSRGEEEEEEEEDEEEEEVIGEITTPHRITIPRLFHGNVGGEIATGNRIDTGKKRICKPKVIFTPPGNWRPKAKKRKPNATKKKPSATEKKQEPADDNKKKKQNKRKKC